MRLARHVSVTIAVALAAGCTRDLPTASQRPQLQPSFEVGVPVSVGSVEATLLYNGQAISRSTTGCGDFRFHLRGKASGQRYDMFPNCDGGPARATNLPVGTYTLAVFYGHPEGGPTFPAGIELAAPVDVEVAAGSTTVVPAYEVSEKIGQVRGRVLINGAPPPTCCFQVFLTLDATPTVTTIATVQEAYVFPPGPPPGAPEAGSFVMLLPEGAATGRITPMTGPVLATFHTNVVAGEASNVGIIAVATGVVEATLLYKGMPIHRTTTGCGDFRFDLREKTSGQRYDMFPNCDGGPARARDLPLGTYTLRVFYGNPNSEPTIPVPTGIELALPLDLEVTGGGVARTASYEVGDKVGQVRGKILINGAPPPTCCFQVVLTLDAKPHLNAFATVQPAFIFPPGPPPGAPEAGSFVVLLPPGAATGRVTPMTGPVLATFHTTVVAGEQSNVLIETGSGAVEATLLYKGQPLNRLTTGCGDFRFDLRDKATGQRYDMFPSCDGGPARARDLPAGTYTLRVFYGNPESGPTFPAGIELAAPVDVQVSAGNTAIAPAYEVSDKIGQVRGRVLINGAPPTTCCFQVFLTLDASPTLNTVATVQPAFIFPPGPPPGAPEAGSFVMLIPPGAVTGQVTPMTGPPLVTFRATVVAGQTTDVGNPLNSPPIANAGGPYSGTEGTAIDFDGSASSDPENQPLTYHWTFGDNTPPSSAASPSHVYVDNGTYTVTLQVNDPAGGSNVTTTQVTIANVAPTARLVHQSSVNEGSPLLFRLESPTDVSVVDRAMLEFAFDCGDGRGLGPWGRIAFAMCPTSDDAVREIKAAIRDKDGGVSEYTATTTVLNVSPSIQPFTGGVIIRGETYAASSSFADPGADSWTATVDFGPDGARPLTLQGKSFQLSNRYMVAGRFLVAVQVTDDDGGVGSQFASVFVQTAAEAAQALLSRVQQLVPNMDDGRAVALEANATSALRSLQNDQNAAAITQLRSFVRHVDALVASGDLAPAVGAILSAFAERIIRAAEL